MPGATYANDRGTGWLCRVHGAYEMWHTCGGGEGEPLGYCEAWPGDYKEETRDETPFHRFRDPTCEFDPNRWDEEEDDG